jgi:hypothetical protein
MRQSRERERTKGQGKLNKRRKDERSEDSVWRQWGIGNEEWKVM